MTIGLSLGTCMITAHRKYMFWLINASKMKTSHEIDAKISFGKIFSIVIVETFPSSYMRFACKQWHLSLWSVNFGLLAWSSIRTLLYISESMNVWKWICSGFYELQAFLRLLCLCLFMRKKYIKRVWLVWLAILSPTLWSMQINWALVPALMFCGFSYCNLSPTLS